MCIKRVKQKDVVQVMNIKYKDEPVDCTKCSKSMLVVDIIYDFAEGSLEYLTLVDNGAVYPNLNYAQFCSKVYNVLMDLVDYSLICNNVLRGIDSSLALTIGENILLRERQEKTVRYENDRVYISAKSLRLTRDKDFKRIPKNVVYVLGSIYTGVGYMLYDKQFKGKRLGFDNVLKGVTQKDIFAQEFANIMMLRTNFLGCDTVVSQNNKNRLIVLKALKERGLLKNI